ncbi:GWT1-domain-containing protein [Radiomyces spectabilis]|uniref:GWT1-domain-containing protein n=1 Tax=Radiomyces spectabilis TaxID=64574 RepID=UPI0022211DE4|nr:GWT1-domain-containing protein [Radiomyces spectabilis]KAI8381424.1 GWT1-domain-containing protein [Radiomyces spectabilis]
MITDEQYKREKEAWVTDCTGGSIAEILTVCATFVGSHCLWCALRRNGWSDDNSYLVQFVIYALPLLICQTVVADHAALVATALLTTGLTMFYWHPMPSTNVPSTSNIKPYLTAYRAGTMILTCIAILAVDFPIFPRRFAKVENFGTSLMDVGVGSFVFSSGIVASRGYTHGKQASSPFLSQMVKAIRSSLRILALGFLRMILTKGVDYQQHTSEYGLHWNFFFTLGFLPPFVTLISFLRKVCSFFVLGSILAVGYQLLLTYGLQTWVLEAPRVTLISANKEGICSFIGYLSIFLFGLDCGTLIFSEPDVKKQPPSSTFSSSANYRTARGLTVRATGYWLALTLWNWLTADQEGLHVSRRLTNLPYIIWVIAFNITLLAALIWIEWMDGQAHSSPLLLQAINKHGLPTFLLANVLTGVINLSMKTLYASTTVSLTVCGCYIAVVTLVPSLLWLQFRV